jgi:hypothetical protein
MNTELFKSELKKAIKDGIKNAANKEVRNGNKAIQIISNMMFYGQYYKDEFQVLESKPYSEIAYKNWLKKYSFV